MTCKQTTQKPTTSTPGTNEPQLETPSMEQVYYGIDVRLAEIEFARQRYLRLWSLAEEMYSALAAEVPSSGNEFNVMKQKED